MYQFTWIGINRLKKLVSIEYIIMIQIQKWPLHWQILCGMALGTVGGIILQMSQGLVEPLIAQGGFWGFIADGLGQINHSVGQECVPCLRWYHCRRLLIGNGQPTISGRIGLKTAAVYLFTTAMAISIGLMVALLLKPTVCAPKCTLNGLCRPGQKSRSR